jgi:hypothetical protein
MHLTGTIPIVPSSSQIHYQQVEAFRVVLGAPETQPPRDPTHTRPRSSPIGQHSPAKSTRCRPRCASLAPESGRNIPLLPHDLENPFLEPDGFSRFIAASDRLDSVDRFQTTWSELPNVVCQSRAQEIPICRELPPEDSTKVRFSPRFSRPWLLISHASPARVLDPDPGLLSGRSSARSGG